MATSIKNKIRNTSAYYGEWRYFFVIKSYWNSNIKKNICKIIQKKQWRPLKFHYKKISMLLKIIFVTQEENSYKCYKTFDIKKLFSSK